MRRRRSSFAETRSVSQWRLSKTIPWAPADKKAAAASGVAMLSPDDQIRLRALVPNHGSDRAVQGECGFGYW